MKTRRTGRGLSAFDLALTELDPRTHPDQLTSEFVDRAFGSFLTRADRLIVDSIG